MSLNETLICPREKHCPSSRVRRSRRGLLRLLLDNCLLRKRRSRSNLLGRALRLNELAEGAEGLLGNWCRCCGYSGLLLLQKLWCGHELLLLLERSGRSCVHRLPSRAQEHVGYLAWLGPWWQWLLRYLLQLWWCSCA